MSIQLLLLFIHLSCAALWLGCVLVEAIYEHTAEATDTMRRYIARLHWATDLWVETPAFVLVLLTGIGLLSMSTLSIWLLVKIALGSLAIVANMICVILVFKRRLAAQRGHFQYYAQLDHRQHQFGALVLIGIIGAFIIGGYLFAHGLF